MQGGSTATVAPTRLRPLTISVCGKAGVGKTALLARLAERFGNAALLRASEAPSDGVFADPSCPPDVLIVVTDALQGFSPDARQAAAIAATAGVRHLILAVDRLDVAEGDLAAFEAAEAALRDFAGKFAFATAVAVPVPARSGDNVLTTHLASLAADATGDTGAADEGLAERGQLTEQFAAHVACLSDQPLIPGREYKLNLGGHEVTASVNQVKFRLDVGSLHRLPARTLAKGEIGVCSIATHVPVALGDPAALADAGRFTLSDLFTGATIAAGTVDFALRRGMNIHWQQLTVTKELRAALKPQRPCVVWLTGLSGAGKSTIANLVEGWLALNECHTYLLDGDNVRHGLNKDLGFTAADRVENIRRVGEVARLFVDAGLIVLCSFISPFRAEREAVRSLLEPGEFIEIHVTAPLAVCERRDPKGLYAKCRAGQLPNFTGIDSPYEAPEAADLVLDTTSAPAGELAQKVVTLLQERGFVLSPEIGARAVGGL